MRGGERQAKVEAGWCYDAQSGRWVPPGQLFGELPQTAGRNEGRRRFLVEVKQTLLTLLQLPASRGDGGA